MVNALYSSAADRIAAFYTTNGMALKKDMIHVSSQRSVIKPQDNSADFFRIEKIERESRDIQRTRRELGGALGLIEVAQQAGTYVFDDIKRMKELVEFYYRDETSSQEKDQYGLEFDAIKRRVTDQIASATYNGKQLIADTSSADPLISVQLDANNLSQLFEVEFDAGDVADVTALDITVGEENALAAVEGEMGKAGSYLAKISAYQQGLYAQDAIGATKILENEKVDESIGGLDNATAISAFFMKYIRQQSASAMLVQANMTKENVLKLLG